MGPGGGGARARAAGKEQGPRRACADGADSARVRFRVGLFGRIILRGAFFCLHFGRAPVGACANDDEVPQTCSRAGAGARGHLTGGTPVLPVRCETLFIDFNRGGGLWGRFVDTWHHSGMWSSGMIPL